MEKRNWPKRTPIEVRFWAKVVKNEDGCWGWNGATHKFGYGVLGTGGKHGVDTAHRISWQIHFGEIPEGQEVLHHCDNPPCSRPDHLFLGTQAKNMQDMAAKKRYSRPNQKLTQQQVIAIKEEYAAGNVFQKTLAAKYGVKRANISAILVGR